MLASVRKSLGAVGGLQVVLAVLAVGWGLSTLQKVVEDRQAALEDLAERQAEAEAVLSETVAAARAAAAPYEPSNYGTYARTGKCGVCGSATCNGHASTDYPSSDDLDPLSKGAQL